MHMQLSFVFEISLSFACTAQFQTPGNSENSLRLFFLFCVQFNKMGRDQRSAWQFIIKLPTQLPPQKTTNHQDRKTSLN